MPGFVFDGYHSLSATQTKHANTIDELGAVIIGSSNIIPQSAQEKLQSKFPQTIVPGIELLSFERTTSGVVTRSETAPTKPDEAEMTPIRRRASRASSRPSAETCSKLSAPMPLRYICIAEMPSRLR